MKKDTKTTPFECGWTLAYLQKKHKDKFKEFAEESKAYQELSAHDWSNEEKAQGYFDWVKAWFKENGIEVPNVPKQ